MKHIFHLEFYSHSCSEPRQTTRHSFSLLFALPYILLGICSRREGFEAALGPERRGRKGVASTASGDDGYFVFKIEIHLPNSLDDSLMTFKKCKIFVARL
ncbi:MAG: hypothetical protein ACI8UZ_000241 [Akkermansiaceae bacterium]|jgi:hypothetical protein